jgi:hypothetical protein
MRPLTVGCCAGALALATAGCGGSHPAARRGPAGKPRPAPPAQTVTQPPPTGSGQARDRGPRLAEILAVPEVGRFTGRCAQGEKRWTLRFAPDPVTATDVIVYAFGSGPRHSTALNPGQALTWQLASGAARTREPADPLSHHGATTVSTTEPLHMTISQGTEPHAFRVDVTLALASAIGDTADCAPVASTLRAETYFNGVP